MCKEKYKALTIRDCVDVSIMTIIGATPYVGGAISAASSAIGMKQTQKRIIELENLTPIISDLKQNEERFFEHRQIILKFIEDADVLDKDLQENIANYVINCKHRSLYKYTIDFLLKLPTFMINECKELNYFGKHQSIKEIALKEEDSSPLILSIEQYAVPTNMRSIGSSRLYPNKLVVEILCHCLKILPEIKETSLEDFET